MHTHIYKWNKFSITEVNKCTVEIKGGRESDTSEHLLIQSSYGVSHHPVHVGRFPKVGRDQDSWGGFVISGLQDKPLPYKAS